MSSDSLFIKCKTCGKDIPKKIKTCPQCGSRNKKKLGVLHWIFFGFFALGVIGVISSPDPPTNKTETNKLSSIKHKDIKSILEFQPKEQVNFIEVVTEYTQRFSNAKNELQQSVLRDERKLALEGSLNKYSISSWVGKLKRLETNSEGNAIISISISPNIEIQTYNNIFSDIGSDTLIEKNTPLYSDLLKLSIGQIVKFTGTFFDSDEDFLQETSLTIDGSMRNPEFLFKFQTIEPITL